MKKTNSWLIFALLALAAVFIISGCDVENPITDDWWVGDPTGATAPTSGSGTGSGGGGGGGGGLGPAVRPTGPTRGGPMDHKIPFYTVTFTLDPDKYEEYFDAINGNSDTIIPQAIREGALVQEPGLVIIDPPGNAPPNHHDASSNLYFSGWYTDGGRQWDFSSDTVDETEDLADGIADGIIKLYPRWEPSGSTVTFEPGGDFDHDTSYDSGTEIDWSNTIYPPEPEFVASGVPLSEPKGFGLKTDDPLADDYVFTGWYIDGNNDGIVNTNLDVKWNFNTPVTGDMKLYAGWGTKTAGGVIPPEKGGSPKPVYTVTFNDGGADNPVPAQEILEGNPITRPDAVYKTGEAFTGWHTDSPTGPPYEFDEEDPVTGDITLYAGWANTDFTVVFKSNGGDYIDLVNDPDNNDPAYINPPDQRVVNNSKEVYEPGLVKGPPGRQYIDGWYTTPDTGGTQWVFNTTIASETFDVVDGGDDDGDIELYARWSDTGSTVTFDAGGDFDQNGKYDPVNEINFTKTTYTPEPEYVTTDVPLSEPKGFGLKSGDPLADDYVFTGWYEDNNNNGIVDTDDTKWDFTRTDHGNMTLYAGWGTKTANGDVIPPEAGGTPIPVYTVTFNDNGADDPDSNPATKVVPDETVVTGNTVPRPDAIHKKDYVFSGWYKDATLRTPWDFTAVTEIVDETDDTFGGGSDDNSFTLYAKWELKPYSFPWFIDNYYSVNDFGMPTPWYPFQCHPGDENWYYPGDGSPEETTNFNNQQAVVNSLRDDPTAVALIVGYKDNPADPGADPNITEAAREEYMWGSFDDMGVSERLFKYTDYNLPAGAVPAGAVPGRPIDGITYNDEVRIYVLTPKPGR